MVRYCSAPNRFIFLMLRLYFHSTKDSWPVNTLKIQKSTFLVGMITKLNYVTCFLKNFMECKTLMLFLTLSWYHETNKSWSHENQAETNNNAQPLWASVIIFAKFCFGATMDFKSLYYSRTWSFVSWNQRDIFPHRISHSFSSMLKISGHANWLQLNRCPFI